MRQRFTNALNQTIKEVRQRFDFKGSAANVVMEKTELVLSAEDETKLRNMNDILQQKLVRRGVPLKASVTARRTSRRRHRQATRADPTGHSAGEGEGSCKFIKDSKAKVQASIQGDVVRVTGRDRDTLQDIIAKLKDKDFGIHMQFTNYRSN